MNLYLVETMLLGLAFVVSACVSAQNKSFGNI